MHICVLSLVQRLRSRMKYNEATTNMGARYRTATQQQLDACGRICCICLEEMVLEGADREKNLETDNDEAPEPSPEPRLSVAYLRWHIRNLLRTVENIRIFPKISSVPKRLLCGHIFHFSCLRGWLERQQTCPTCRWSVTETSEIPNYFNALHSSNRQDAQDNTSVQHPQSQPPPENLQVGSDQTTNNDIPSPPAGNAHAPLIPASSTRAPADLADSRLMLVMPEKRLYNIYFDESKTLCATPADMTIFSTSKLRVAQDTSITIEERSVGDDTPDTQDGTDQSRIVQGDASHNTEV